MCQNRTRRGSNPHRLGVAPHVVDGRCLDGAAGPRSPVAHLVSPRQFGQESMMSTVQASHILLMYQGSERSTATRTKEQAQQLIDSIQQRLTGGEDFATLARQHSDCPSSSKGGDLGRFGKGQMVKPFEDTAFGLEVGGVSGIVETPFGYHIIKRTA
ncbi:MAG: peptidylprolyl isomerase [Myxococcota bacterium]